MGLHGQIGRLLGAALLIGASGILNPAHAHFFLMQPDSWKSQGMFGDPQKVGPCGEEGGGTVTNKVTPFRPGQTIEITVDERIHHPGHYRVALAVNDRNELPAPPKVIRVDQDPCGSAEIQDPPIFPILADNMLPHTQPFEEPQTFTVTLPTDVTCARCTLQIIEYMSHHGAPCFYHHCADISIQGDATTPTATSTPMDTTPSTPAATGTAVVSGTATATPILSEDCSGDCDGSGAVTIDEIVTLVNIALERAEISVCEAGNADGNRQVTVNEIVTAVNTVLSGCPARSLF